MTRPPIVTVPDPPARPEPTSILTRPPPDTLDGLTPIQLGFAVTAQLQLLGPLAVTSATPPEEGRLTDVGDTLVGDAGQPTVTGMTRPPILTVPDPPALPEDTATVTLPPVDTVDGVVVIHDWLSLTDQRQPVGPVTVRRPVPPDAGRLNEEGATRVGDEGHGRTVMGMSRVPILTVPDPPALPEDTATVTLPPVNTVDGVVVIHDWLSLTDQRQPVGPVTDRDCVPPAGRNVNGDGVTRVGRAGQPDAWVTSMPLPPIVTLPDRCGPGFASTEIVTSGLTVMSGVQRLLRNVTRQTTGPAESQSRSVSTEIPAHRHAVAELKSSPTDTVREPAPPPNVSDPGTDTTGEQAGYAPCDTGTPAPPMLRLPDRSAPAFLGTRTTSRPPPDTLDDCGVIQSRSSLTSQLQ